VTFDITDACAYTIAQRLPPTFSQSCPPDLDILAALASGQLDEEEEEGEEEELLAEKEENHANQNALEVHGEWVVVKKKSSEY